MSKDVTYKCDHCKEPIGRGGCIDGRVRLYLAGYNNPPSLTYKAPDDKYPDLCEECMIKDMERRLSIKFQRTYKL